MAGTINIGSIEADLKIDSGNLESGLAKGRVAMVAFEKELGTLFQELQSGNILFADYAARITAVGDAQTRLAAQMQAAYAAVGTGNGGLLQTVNATSQMANGFARAGMQFGYMVDDIQYGVSSIVNNVAPLAQSLATSLGASGAAANAWGAGAQIAAVAAYQLYRHWDDLLKLMEIPIVRTEAEEMENLANKTKRTADETERLNKYKKEQAEIKRLVDSHTDDEEDRAKDIGKAITEAGGKKVIGELAKSMGASMTPQEQAEIRDLEDRIAHANERPNQFGGILRENEGAFDESGRVEEEKKRNIDLLEERNRQIQDRINKENVQRAGNLAVDAEHDPDALKSMIAKIRRNPKAFPDGLVQSLEAELPENREKQKQALIDAKGEKNARKFDVHKAKEDEKEKKEGEKFDDEKFEDDIRERQQAVRRRDQKKKEAVHQVKKDSAGIDTIAENLAAGMMTGDISPQDAMNRIVGILKSNDTIFAKEQNAAWVTPGLADDVKAEDRANERAGIAAREIMNDAGGDLKKRVIDEAVNPSRDDEQRKVSQSQQFDAGQLAAKVQAGVNDEDKQERKKQTSFLDQAVKYLAVMAKNQNENPLAGFQEK